MPAVHMLCGKIFGRLEVIGETPIRKGKRLAWLCQCSCGVTCEILAESLNAGRTQSCGCLHKELAAQRQYKHGGKGSEEYLIWKGMKQRCENPRNPNYKNYGARGITICAAWRTSFATFLHDMGPRPSPQHSLDRQDGAGNYTPENCRWATPLMQARNTRRNRLITHNDRTMTLSMWAEETGIAYAVLFARLDRLGWDIPRALTTPNQHYSGRKSLKLM